ncbi:hypothetical protein MtrunA17_Chr1g0159371 [Medicago truncatula]|uniref:Uncharacterized protein n=1 Tax=Medicago truncatula TaxID=3880 RepID=A0A396JT81_MEDTR|nr:hypothetical protein MtrunA17_Chr1g0159371 [Medicago truncatula]
MYLDHFVLNTYYVQVLLEYVVSEKYTTKNTKISEGNFVRKNVKSLSNSVNKFYDQRICEEFDFFRH